MNLFSLRNLPLVDHHDVSFKKIMNCFETCSNVGYM